MGCGYGLIFTVLKAKDESFANSTDQDYTGLIRIYSVCKFLGFLKKVLGIDTNRTYRNLTEMP